MSCVRHYSFTGDFIKYVCCSYSHTCHVRSKPFTVCLDSWIKASLQSLICRKDVFHRGIAHKIGISQPAQSLKYCKIKLECIVKYGFKWLWMKAIWRCNYSFQCVLVFPLGGIGRVVNGAFMVLKGHRSIVNQVRFNPHTYMICSSGVEKIIKVR